MQDFEFTIEKGSLWMLQTRNGKRTGLAAVKIAVDMCEEGLITPEEALMRVEPEQLNQLLRPDLRAREPAQGRRGRPGPGQGPGRRPRRRHRQVVFNAADAEAWAGRRRSRSCWCARDVPGGHPRHGPSREGILTARGGMTCHAALVARQMGKVCVVGCEALDIDYKARTHHGGRQRW